MMRSIPLHGSPGYAMLFLPGADKGAEQIDVTEIAPSARSNDNEQHLNN